MITNNHVITCDMTMKQKTFEMDFDEGKETRQISLSNRRAFNFNKQDITVVQMIPEDEIPEQIYLELDPNYLESGSRYYSDKLICTFLFPVDSKKRKNTVIGYDGNITDIQKDEQFFHDCPSIDSCSGAPVLLASSLRVIGVHRGRLGKQISSLTALKFASFAGFIPNELDIEEPIQDTPLIKEESVYTSEMESHFEPVSDQEGENKIQFEPSHQAK